MRAVGTLAVMLTAVFTCVAQSATAETCTLVVKSLPFSEACTITSSTGHGGTTAYTLTGIAQGTNVNLTAPPTGPDGYIFWRWRESTGQCFYQSSVSLPMLRSRYVFAEYRLTTYCVSSGVGEGAKTPGDDNNPGTPARPFKTVTKAASVLQGGDTLILRGGEYDTENGLTEPGSICSSLPSGKSWEEPTTLRTHPGEKPVLRRFMPSDATIDEITYRNSWHLPTYQEAVAAGCAERFPYSAWTAGYGTMIAQSKYANQGPEGEVLCMRNFTKNPLQYIVIDGIDIDGRGICDPVGLMEGADHIRFENLAIRNSISWCVAESGITCESTLERDYQFINVKFSGAGFPYDTNMIDDGWGHQILARKHPLARFWGPFFIRTGGVKVINCDLSDACGTGIGLDGFNNVISGNYIHDNSNVGIYLSGGGSSLITNNVIYNNGGAGVSVVNGASHVVRNNTIIAGNQNLANPTSAGIMVKDSTGTIFENNIIYDFPYGVVNYSSKPLPSSIFRNNLIFCGMYRNRNSLVVANSFPNCEFLDLGNVIPARMDNILGRDPLFNNPFHQDFTLQPESPAIDAGFSNSLLVDHKGNLRPLGAAIDIGAYECPGYKVLAFAGQNPRAENTDNASTPDETAPAPTENASLYPIPAGADAIVDDLDNSESKKFSILGGEWTKSAEGTGAYAGGCSRAPAVTGYGEAHARFTCTTLPVGQYDVYVRWPVKENNAANVAYEVLHAGGLSTVRINQAQSGGSWTLIGRFDFDAGKHNVDIYNSNSKPGAYVCADAVRFVAAGTQIAR